ncbi:MAG: cation:proton antiporter, partial [Candidatus Peregrinibacteria bacterium]|nr:cation:proton antiporter [Candidatus Peregrinibacteria bacterium]
LVLGELAELVGLHAIVGAFLAGLFIRQEVFEPRVFNKIEDRIYGLSYSFLAPIFFASLAFYLDFSALQTAPWFTLAIILTAMLGKIIGAGGAALLQKMTFREAATIGIIMNSRGAVDLAIASIGISTGIISKDVFSILVIMAFSVTLVSTLTLRFAGEFILPQKKTWWQKLLGMKS